MNLLKVRYKNFYFITLIDKKKKKHRTRSFYRYLFCLDRIRQNKGRVRRSKIDYLFYSLTDRIVDQYMDVLDMIGTKIEAIDHQLMCTLSRDTLETIYDLKREMLYFRRSISPLKEIIHKLQKEEETQIIQEKYKYLFESFI